MTANFNNGGHMKPGYPTFITYELLEEKGACMDELDIFQETFPDGVHVTAESILKAAEAELDMEWCAKTFLDRDDREEFFSLLEEAHKTCNKAMTEASQEFSRVTEESLRVYRVTAEQAGAYTTRIAAMEKAEEAFDKAEADAEQALNIAYAHVLIRILGLS